MSFNFAQEQRRRRRKRPDAVTTAIPTKTCAQHSDIIVDDCGEISGSSECVKPKNCRHWCSRRMSLLGVVVVLLVLLVVWKVGVTLEWIGFQNHLLRGSVSSAQLGPLDTLKGTTVDTAHDIVSISSTANPILANSTSSEAAEQNSKSSAVVRLEEVGPVSGRISGDTDGANKIRHISSSCRHSDEFCECDRTASRIITIRGERHHGTNWIRSIINRNTDACKVRFDLNRRNRKLDADGAYGWKHGLLRPQDQLSENVILLVVTRDVFPWLLSMYRIPYTVKNLLFYFPDPQSLSFQKLSFSDFIRQPWRDGCQLSKFYQKDCPLDTADNIIQLRSVKYRNWLSETPSYFGFPSQPPHNTRSHLRYESVVELGQEATVGAFLRHYNISWWSEGMFSGQNALITRAESKTTGIETDIQAMLRQYSIDDLKFVLSQLDLQWERNTLNYSYEYVEEYIRKNETALSIPPYGAS